MRKDWECLYSGIEHRCHSANSIEVAMREVVSRYQGENGLSQKRVDYLVKHLVMAAQESLHKGE